MRYLPLTAEDRREMLARIGVGRVDDLFSACAAERIGAATADCRRLQVAHLA